jgi:soluble lytic murein transglycosylase-like protein
VGDTVKPLPSACAKWTLWALGFVAGFALATWLALGVLTAGAQSPEVAYALDHAADTYGVSRRCLWNIARRESGFRPWVDNYQGSGARGLMQFKDATWRFMSRASDWGGWSVYDPWAAAHVAAWAIANPGPSQGGLAHWGGWC